MARRLLPLALLLLAGSAPAQDLPPPSPADLARGLRENGLADLALEYLTEVAATSPPDVQKVLPLERAKCRLELATTESDDALRSALVADAKKEFDAFVKGNPGHPRLPEAAVALAQLQTLDGKTQMQRANRLPADQRANELAKARTLFEAAGKQYAVAADVLKKKAEQEEPNTPRHKEVTQDYLQAVVDQGMNQFLLAVSFGETPAGKDVDAKVKAAKDAAILFDSVWVRYKDYPQGWAARAWTGECLREQFEPNKAAAALKTTLDEGQKAKTVASAAGVKMARFFLLREEYVGNGGEAGVSVERQKVRNAARDWLKDYAAGRPTAEVFAVRYYFARASMNEGLKRENSTWEQTKEKDADGKLIEKRLAVRETGLALLREADAQFKLLVRAENEFTERATRQRPTALRWLVGNPDRPPAQFATFDDTYMAALVQMEGARTAEKDDERATHLNKAIALLERANVLPVPPESARDAARADLDLARAYSAAGRPHSAAVFAEHTARSARSPGAAAKAAVIALDAYGRTARTTAPEFEDGRAVDRDRRVSLAQHLEKVAPNEPETDAARMQLGGDLYVLGRKLEAFEAFSRVPARYPGLAQARLFEGITAFDLIRPLPPEETRADDLPADKKAAVFQRAVADLSAVPAPADSAKDDPSAGVTPVTDYFNMRLQLAQLHVTQGAKAYPTAEQTVVSSAAAAARHPGLPADDKTKFAMRFESLRIRTVYGQAMPLFTQGKYAEAAERFTGLLTEVLAAGPAVKPKQPADVVDLAKALDGDRIRLLLVPTLNAHVRAGAAAKTAELLDELKKFGGDLSTSARVVQQGVASIRPAVDALRKDKKTEDADKLTAAVTGMVTKLAAEPNLPVDVRLNLGKSFRELGEYAKAAEQLSTVPAPDNKDALKGELKAAENETEEQAKKRDADNSASPLYRQARLELARAYRLDKKFAEAAAVLDDALGKEGAPKPNSVAKSREGGWAGKFLEYRKEAILLIEARAAAATDPKASAPLWNEALAHWRVWVAEYFNRLNQLNQKYIPKKREVEVLTFRQRLLTELADLADKGKVDLDEVRVKTLKDLEQSERDQEKAGEEVGAATKALEKAASVDDISAGREKLEAARAAAEGVGRKTAELKARPPALDEHAKKLNPNWAAEAADVQKLIDPLQKETGELERLMNPTRSVWQDVYAEQLRCVLAAQASILKPSKPTDFDTWVGKHGRNVADFEKANRPLPPNVRQKLYDMLSSHKPLMDAYRAAGGIDMIAPPAGNP